MPTIHVEMFAGRTPEQKRALALALTEATVHTLGGSAASVDVIFTDIQRHDWATGGKLWSDVVQPAASVTKAMPKDKLKAKPKGKTAAAPAAAPAKAVSNWRSKKV